MDFGMLKYRAKAAFKANYWTAVIVAVFLSIALGSGASSTLGSVWETAKEHISSLSDNEKAAAMFAVLGVAAGGGFLMSVLNILFVWPLEIGLYGFFKNNHYRRPNISEIFDPFQNNYPGNLLTMLLMNIFLALWSMLFVIPGIIKSYSYRLVPYIRSEHPEYTPTQTITRSRQMMNGHKFEAFCLDLSFIGWFLLSCMTCGLLGIFYVFPYYYSTHAAYYIALREQETRAAGYYYQQY